MRSFRNVHKLFFYYNTNQVGLEGFSLTIAILFIYLSSFFAAYALNHTAAAGAALLEGAQDALRFSVELGAALCLWSAVTELLERAGAVDALSRLLRPALEKLFPHGARDRETLAALSENVGANLLGLGNAATPAGVRAAKGLKRLGARAELNTLVVLNTASVQLLPTMAASLRAALGSASPFDITPAVWLSSALALTAGLAAIGLLNGSVR